jgi:hypothetical protein
MSQEGYRCLSQLATSLGGNRSAYRSFVSKPECTKRLGRRRHRCEDDIEIDFGKQCVKMLIGFKWLSTTPSGVFI